MDNKYTDIKDKRNVWKGRKLTIMKMKNRINRKKRRGKGIEKARRPAWR